MTLDISSLYDVEPLIRWGGLLLVCVVVFVETGLLVGFFLPGDSLLFTAGVLSAAGYLPLVPLLLFASICAVAGDQLGYQIGRQAGRRLFRNDARVFKDAHLQRARDFYARHGKKTIVLARFVPVIRTFAPTVAGAAAMDYRLFTFYNVIGGVIWVFGLVGVGYALGALIPGVSRYLHFVVLLIIVLSLVPVLREWRRR